MRQLRRYQYCAITMDVGRRLYQDDYTYGRCWWMQERVAGHATYERWHEGDFCAIAEHTHCIAQPLP